MIKWGEGREGDVLFEVFLPEHDRESSCCLLRASCQGQIVQERQIRLTWPPRFGPDMGDVAAIEAELEALNQEIAQHPMPTACLGNYTPRPVESVPQEPMVHAWLYSLIRAYVEAESLLSLTPEQTAAYLELPTGATADGLYPIAVMQRRERRMRHMIAMASLIESEPGVHALKSELIDAVLRDDAAEIRSILGACGIEEPSWLAGWSAGPSDTTKEVTP